jgi:REG-2-like HAD superfamily hydrolase
MARLRLLTFDITNTILRVKGSPGQEYARAAWLRGIQMSSEDLDQVYRPTWKKMRAELPIYGHNQGMSTWEWWRQFVHKVFINAGYQGPDKTLDAVCETLWQRFDEGFNWDVLPHSHQVLTHLRTQGLKLGVISNFDERLEKTLKTHNLKKYFDFFVSAVAVNAEKPDPRIFHHALAIAGVRPEEAGHIGDDVDHDYRASREVGMVPFLIDPQRKVLNNLTPEYKDLDPDSIVTDMCELVDLVTPCVDDCDSKGGIYDENN